MKVCWRSVGWLGWVGNVGTGGTVFFFLLWLGAWPVLAAAWLRWGRDTGFVEGRAGEGHDGVDGDGDGV